VVDSSQYIISNQTWFYLFIYFIVGLLGFAIFPALSDHREILFGMTIGWYISNILVFSNQSGADLIASTKFIILFVFMALGIALGKYMKDLICCFGVSFFGSYCIFTGLEYFVDSQFNYINFQFTNKKPIIFTDRFWAMLAGFTSVLLHGGIFQRSVYKNREDNDRVLIE
jgi:hypothetical protein